jgi:hypothetical protein
MKQILLSLSFFAFLVCAAGFVFITGPVTPESSTGDARREFSDARGNNSGEILKTEGNGERAEQDRDADGDSDLPLGVRHRLEKLRRSVPGVRGEGPAGSAAEWKFKRRAYPDTDISVDKIEGARAAHAAQLEMNFADSSESAAATWTSLGPSSALVPRSIESYPDDFFAGGRTTGLAIDPVCIPGHCRLWATAAGGGVWRTDNALRGQPIWTFLSSSFGINAAGSIVLDPNNSNEVWVGTGEANSSGDSGAGVGLYESTDGGDTWTGPIGKSVFNARAIGSIVIDPTNSNTIYAATTRAYRGISSVSGGSLSAVPGAPPWGLYKSTDGGAHWSFIFNGAESIAGCTNPVKVVQNLTLCSSRGVSRVALDPVNPNIVYASAFAKGVWRSNDGGNTWNQIFLPVADPVATSYVERPEIAVNKLPNGKTRMYVVIGQFGLPPAQTYVSNNVASGTPSFILLTSKDPASNGFATFDSCTGQCAYDSFVYTPPGSPDVVYVGGSLQYEEFGRISNGRGVVLSTDGGKTFTDMTLDVTDGLNSMHPDQHALVTNPRNPLQFFEGNDGGIIRSSGALGDMSAVCTSVRELSGVALRRCQQLLSAVPTRLRNINKGLTTLQFYSLSVSPFDPTLIQGGTQDNGTWQSTPTPGLFVQTIYGDGGQSGFDVDNPKFRFHTSIDATPDVNFSNGATYDWNWIGDPIYGTGEEAYPPIISDPVVSGTMFVGTATVYRTKTHGMGTMSLSAFRHNCNYFFGVFAAQCGDWVPIGSTPLTASSLGTWAGGSVAAVQRTASDTSTLWVATSTGRVFISRNADADPNAVVFTRVDTSSSSAPNRYVTGIVIDPANSNHAWISYDGYSATTPSTPGHVFEVTYDPVSQAATLNDRSNHLGDLPINDVVLDSVTGDLYASSDFGVYRLPAGSSGWRLAARGMPKVEVPGLTIVPNARLLYAATHGLGAWVLRLK